MKSFIASGPGLTPKIRPLASLDITAQEFIRVIFVCAVITKILCAGSYAHLGHAILTGLSSNYHSYRGN